MRKVKTEWVMINQQLTMIWSINGVIVGSKKA
jgi:hypothetical protein